MTRNEIISILERSGVSAPGHVWDRDYACPTLRYIQNDFAKEIANIRFQLGLERWSPEANDCDNFAVYAMAHFQVCHAKTNNHPAAGIAFGVFCYSPKDGNGNHAINFAVCDRELIFFEPQNYQVKQLTREEIESCSDYLLC